jgi:hypothetical protein
MGRLTDATFPCTAGATYVIGSGEIVEAGLGPQQSVLKDVVGYREAWWLYRDDLGV